MQEKQKGTSSKRAAGRFRKELSRIVERKIDAENKSFVMRAKNLG